MPDFSRSGVVPPSITTGKIVIVVGFTVMAMQIAVWAATGKWLDLTFAYVLEPVFSFFHLGSWLIFPHSFLELHRGVLFVMGLPLGLTFLLVGLLIFRMLDRV